MFDDEVTDRLRRLGNEIEETTVLAPAATVRTRGDRRRDGAGAAVAVGVTILAITAGVAVVGMDADPFQALGPGSRGDRTTIPATLVMLHEGESGWQRSDDPAVSSSVNPCQDADATLPGRTDARTLTGRGLAVEEEHSPSLVTHQLFLYADDAAARAAFDGLATEAAACGWGNSVPMMNRDETSTMLRLRKQDSGTYQQVKDRYWLHDAVVVRDGNALFLASSETKGSGMTSNLADQELGWILDPICRARLVCRSGWASPLPSVPAGHSPGDPTPPRVLEPGPTSK